MFANQKFFFSPILVGVLLLFTYIWQFQITDSASNLKQFVAFVTNRGNVKTSAAAQSVINLNPFKNTFTTNQEDVQTYYQSVSYEYSKLSYIHTTGVKSNYNIEPVSLEALPITNTKMFLIEQVSYKIVSVIMKIFLVLGVIYLVCFELRKKKIHPEMIFMTAISLVLLVIIILIPDISLEYNYERLLQQVLFTLSIALLFGAYTTLKFLKSKRIVDFILTILFIIYFFYFIGFFGYFIGGEPSSAILNNSGSNYDLDFTPDTEVYSIKWLSTNYNKSNLVYVDKASERKVIAYGGITKGTKLDILPTTVDKDAYVYLSYSNYVDKIVYELFQGKDITYSLPDQFLNDNKNLIYSNGGSVIYK